MKNKLLRLTLLLLIAVCSVTTARADAFWPYAGFYEVYMTYSYSGNKTNYTFYSGDNNSSQSQDLGTLTADFEVNDLYLKCYKNTGDWSEYGNLCGGLMIYNTGSGDNEYQPTWTWTDKSTWSNTYQAHLWELSKTGCNKVIASYNTGASGSYTAKLAFKMWGSDDNGSDCGDIWWISNNSNNYKFTYKIAPPAISSFSVSKSGHVAGSGTSLDPYIIPYDGTLTLTVSGSKGRTDANSTIKYWKNSGSKQNSNVLTVTNVTSTDLQSVVVHAQCVNNSTSSLVGTESNETVYYKAENRYSITFSHNGHGTISVGGATVSSGSTAYVNHYSTKALVATPNTGYEFTGWTKSGTNASSVTIADMTASGATTTIKSTATSATVAAGFSAIDYTITYSPSPAVNFTYTTAPTSANYGDQVDFTFTPATNYIISSVTAVDGSSNSVTVTEVSTNNYRIASMPASDITVTVTPALGSVSLTYGAGDNGSLSAKVDDVATDSGEDIDGGSQVDFTATPNTGYEVEGWYTSYSAGVFSGKIDAAGTNTTYTIAEATSDITVYVKFVLSTYTITYNLNGGTNDADNPDSYQYPDETITLKDPTRAGYYFAGWYTSSTFTGGTEKTTIPNHSTGNVTLYAKWIGFSAIQVKPTTLHTGSKTDTIVVGDAITITPTLLNAPSPHYVCPALYKKEEGQWVAQDITFGVSSDVRTIAAKPLAGSKPLPAGEYKISLSLRNGSNCSATEIITTEKVFYIGEQGWYIYGGAFYGWSDSKASIPETRLFLPTSTDGQYYYGPWKFTNDGGGNYQYFRIWSKIENKDYFATSDGNFSLTSSFNSEANGVTLLAGSHSNSFYCTLSDKNYYLYIQNGKMWISSTRPTLAPKIRFYVSGDGGTSKYYTDEVILSDGNPRKASFYHPGGAVTITMQEFVLGTGWTSSSLTFDNPTAITTSILADDKGVYVVDLTWDSSTNKVTISNVNTYTGNYYVRTDHSPGGWNNYSVNGNLFTYSDYTKQKEGYTHYFMKWVEGSGDSDRNVKFDVANEYNSSLSKNQAGFAEDAYANSYGQLKQNANVRFMYNDSTNTLSRAYLSGSAIPSDYYLVLKGDHTAGYHLYTKSDKSAEHKTNGNTDWAFFTDTKNWVYQVDVFATPGTRIKLTAQFTNKSGSAATQYFKGKDGEFNPTNTEALIGGSGSTAYRMRVVYDFKTNRLISAWEPEGDIVGVIEDVDVMLERHGLEAATQITFAAEGENSLTAKNIIGAMRFDYNEMKGKISGWNETTRPWLMYFISFPFDVNVSDLFGLNSAYGEAYILKRYDGAERASKGFFKGDGITTFWKNMTITEKMEKNVGYCLVLDDEYFNGTKGHIWDDKVAGTSVYLYFPSTGNVGSISGESETISIPEHTCTINRTFEGEGGGTVNHQITDSHWNMMGVPVFGNTLGDDDGTPGDVFLDSYDSEEPFKYYYGWNPDNTYEIANAADTTFKAMHSYMVQYHGDVKFTGTAPTPSSVAARRAPLTGKFNIELRALNSEAKMISRTYVELREDACDTFALNEDVYMSYNKRAINLFTYAGEYDVAANVLSLNEHTVPVGIKVRTAGTFTISMASTFSGTVTLVDKQTGVRTNLAISDYTVELPEGVIKDRFTLEISDISNVITDIEYTNGEGSLKDGKAHKFIRNGMLYIVRDGKVYDARGAKVE